MKNEIIINSNITNGNDNNKTMSDHLNSLRKEKKIVNIFGNTIDFSKQNVIVDNQNIKESTTNLLDITFDNGNSYIFNLLTKQPEEYNKYDNANDHENYDIYFDRTLKPCLSIKNSKTTTNNIFVKLHDKKCTLDNQYLICDYISAIYQPIIIDDKITNKKQYLQIGIKDNSNNTLSYNIKQMFEKNKIDDNVIIKAINNTETLYKNIKQQIKKYFDNKSPNHSKYNIQFLNDKIYVLVDYKKLFEFSINNDLSLSLIGEPIYTNNKHYNGFIVTNNYLAIREDNDIKIFDTKPQHNLIAKYDRTYLYKHFTGKEFQRSKIDWEELLLNNNPRQPWLLNDFVTHYNAKTKKLIDVNKMDKMDYEYFKTQENLEKNNNKQISTNVKKNLDQTQKDNVKSK